MKLTQRRIEELVGPSGKLTKTGKPAKEEIVFGDDPRGLGVRVNAVAIPGSLEHKSYLVQYSYGGRKTRMPLGACSAISLGQAVKAAKAILGGVALGRNPARERQERARAAKHKAARDALTLNAHLDGWEALCLKGKRPSYAREAMRALRTAFKKYLDLPAADLDRATAVRALDKLIKEGSPIMAARTGAYLCSAFEWGARRGTVAANPFLKLPRPATVRRERTLTDDELRAVWKAAEGPGAFHAIVRMLLLTGQRREEVAAMTLSELGPDLATWTIPAARAKNGVAHIVPLSEQARAIVAAQPRIEGTPHVFAGRAGGHFKGFSFAKIALDKASGVEGWTLHDLRRTVATGLQRLGVRLEVTEAVLNHVSGSRAGIVGVYQRHTWADEKRAALNAWGARVAAIVEGQEAGGNVVAFAREA
jgi:integrase